MAKRKIDCTLDAIVAVYLKKARCDKSLKLLEGKVGNTQNYNMTILSKFVGYLKQKEFDKENLNNEDLGFEINFGAYQPKNKVSSIYYLSKD